MVNITPALISSFINAVSSTIAEHSEEITKLDQAIGDGDHVINLQRGLQTLAQQSGDLSQLDWQTALQKIGMTVMSSIGGASGSLYGTLFLAMAKASQNKSINVNSFADIFAEGVESVKQRGKANKGEKTMLDVLIPVSEVLKLDSSKTLEFSQMLQNIKQTAESSAEATRDMIAAKGRAAFLGERSKGHLDAGAKSSQLMICAIADVLAANS